MHKTLEESFFKLFKKITVPVYAAAANVDCDVPVAET
jgi:hypothetical protein